MTVAALYVQKGGAYWDSAGQPIGIHPLVKLLRESRLRGDGRLSLCRSETDHPCVGVCGYCRAIEARVV